MLGSFAGTVDNLWKALPDLAMMVDVSKANVLKRQMSKLINRLVNTYFAGLNLP
jgi:hypothetical protein